MAKTHGARQRICLRQGVVSRYLSPTCFGNRQKVKRLWDMSPF
ncbi:hypothetical protein NC653_024027 [Populus alba x Populus x berolinensis]|uniref:Uncharacterized protein n=1 Tax=Populus alba x Populus x berolinensis TaxID=444605 RepID=A0AAD6ML56_9ROSI|nr:hypothetical protein NC653_024027 [Populus alba x Populus x berolinensis]